MNYIETKDLTKQYLLARIPFIAINSIEKKRVERMFLELSKEMNIPIYFYSMSKGLFEITSGKVLNETKTTTGVLDYIGEQLKLKDNHIFVLSDITDIESESVISRFLNDIVTLAEEHNSSIVIIHSGDTIWSNLKRLGMSLELPLPTEEELYEIIKKSILPYKSQIQLEWNEENFKEAATTLSGLSEIEVKNVISSLIATGSITQEDLIDLKYTKDSMFSNISGLEKIEVDKNISIGGLDNLKEWLTEKKKLMSPSKREEMKKRGIKPPRGLLIVGVPGCGKSLCAKAISHMWQLPLYLLDFATVQGQYVGQSERQLKEALEAAESVSPCILWIDEIEKGLSGGSDSNGVTNRMIGQFLFWLQECQKEVFVVATANDVANLPAELLRKGRFDEIFFVDLPTPEEREKIFRIHLAKKNQDSSHFSFNQLLKLSEGYNGAEIEEAINEAMFSAYVDNPDSPRLDNKHLLDAVKGIVPLSKTMKEDIDGLRTWASTRAKNASDKPYVIDSFIEPIKPM